MDDWSEASDISYSEEESDSAGAPPTTHSSATTPKGSTTIDSQHGSLKRAAEATHPERVSAQPSGPSTLHAGISGLLDEGIDLDDGVFGGAFTAAGGTKKKRKAYEIPCRAFDASALRATLEEEEKQLESILGISMDECKLLLRYFKYNKEKLLEYFMDDTDKTLQKAGAPTSDMQQPDCIRTVSHFQCQICCDSGEMRAFSLACGHLYCLDCYRRYVTTRIVEDGEVRRLKCPHDGCTLLMSDSRVSMLVTNETFQNYSRGLMRVYLEDHDDLDWCNGQDCQEIIECHIKDMPLTKVVPTVHCSRGHAYCFACHLPDHQPSICVLTKLWLKKCEDDSETSNWLSANTKECPKCNSITEKNGGCTLFPLYFPTCIVDTNVI